MIPRMETRDNGSDEGDPFEGQDSDDESIDFTEFSKPENLVNQKIKWTRKTIKLLTTQLT